MARKGGTPENLIPIKAGEVRNPNGKPKKIVSHLNAELISQGYVQVTKGQIIDAFQSLINLPLSRINEIANPNNDDYPMLYKLVAKELVGKRGSEMLEKLLDRAYGKSTNTTEISGLNGEPFIPQVIKWGDKEIEI